MCKLMLCALLLVPASMLAQSSPNMVAAVNVTTPKPGTTAQWEAGRKEHSAFHASQKDAWPVFVWQILSGDRTGSYASVEPGHHWSDFDAHEAFDKLDEPEIAKSILPYSAGNTMGLYIFRNDLSRTQPPQLLGQVSEKKVILGGMATGRTVWQSRKSRPHCPFARRGSPDGALQAHRIVVIGERDGAKLRAALNHFRDRPRLQAEGSEHPCRARILVNA